MNPRVSPAAVAAAIAQWAKVDPPISGERIAVETGHGISTVRRWLAGGHEPRMSDVLVLERLRPGLVEALLSVRVTKAQK